MPINITKIRIKIKSKENDIVNFKKFVKIIKKCQKELEPNNQYWYIIRDFEDVIKNYKCDKVLSCLSPNQADEIKNAAVDNYHNDNYMKPIIDYYIDEIMKKVNGEILERV